MQLYNKVYVAAISPHHARCVLSHSLVSCIMNGLMKDSASNLFSVCMGVTLWAEAQLEAQLKWLSNSAFLGQCVSKMHCGASHLVS